MTTTKTKEQLAKLSKEETVLLVKQRLDEAARKLLQEAYYIRYGAPYDTNRKPRASCKPPTKS
jgi:hypothetical protein